MLHNKETEMFVILSVYLKFIIHITVASSWDAKCVGFKNLVSIIQIKGSLFTFYLCNNTNITTSYRVDAGILWPN
jgi:hypothetical protein